MIETTHQRLDIQDFIDQQFTDRDMRLDVWYTVHRMARILGVQRAHVQTLTPAALHDWVQQVEANAKAHPSIEAERELLALRVAVEEVQRAEH